MADFTIAFIVPVLNGEAFLRRCLEQIRTQLRPGDDLIVMDNGSTDRTIAIARSFSDVRVDVRPGLTVAGLRNAGAAQTQCAVLAFIDSDCLLLSGWRKAVVDTLQDEKVVATGSLPEISEQPTWVERAWGSLKFRHALPVRYIPGMNFVVRRSSFESIGGFDAALVTDEDTDLCVRLGESGGVLIENPSVGAIHLGNPRTLRQFITKERWHATSIMGTMARHGIDRPMAMTFAFMGSLIFAVGLLALAILGKTCYLWSLAAVAAIPVITVIYRIWQYRNFGSFFPLILLYVLFYLLRTQVVVRSVLPSTKGTRE